MADRRASIWRVLAAGLAVVLAVLLVRQANDGGSELRRLKAREAELVATRTQIWESYSAALDRWEAGGQVGDMPPRPRVSAATDDELFRVRDRIWEIEKRGRRP